MAKRKRLTPANPNFLGAESLSATEADALSPEAQPEDLDTRGHPLGVVRPRARPATSRPPIAQVAGEASAAAALSELTDALQAARDEGRLIQSLTLSQIDAAHLVRDRLFADEEELNALIESLRKRGQQTPIEVVDHGAHASPRYGLISGWRRMAALARLAGEDASFNRVLALVRSPRTASEAYVAMVEENEIRVGLSYYERARITVKAVEQGVYPDLKTALNDLFANVSRAKRSKIKSFTVLVGALDGALQFPTAIGERLGLELAKRLEGEPQLALQLRSALLSDSPGTIEEEQALLGQLHGRAPAAVPVSKRSNRAPLAEPPNPERPALQISLHFDATAQSLTLIGPGVTDALRRALQTWLHDQ